MTLRQALMALALAGSAWIAMFGDRTPDAELALTSRDAGRQTPAVQTDPIVAAGREDLGRPARPQGAEAPTILRLRQRAPYVAVRGELSPERPIFGTTSWDPPPPKVVPAAPQPPQAPPLPYAYAGKKLEDGVWEVYLTVGDESRVVRPHTTLDARYRVDAITPPTLKLTYLPLSQVQTLTIGAP